MKTIDSLGKIYNLEFQNNYVFMKDEDYVGARIQIIIPYGIINGYDILIPVYMEVFNNSLSITNKYMRVNYHVGLNYSLLDINVIDEKNKLPVMVTIFNLMKTMKDKLDDVYEAFVAWDLIESMKNFREVEEYNYVKDFDVKFNEMIAIAKDPDKCKEALTKCCELIKEEDIMVFYQSKHEMQYFLRSDKFKLDKIDWDLDSLKSKKYVLDFSDLYELLICREILHSTNVFSTEIKRIDDNYILIIHNDKEFVDNALNGLNEHYDEIFDESYTNELYSFIGYNFNNIINNYKKDISFIVKSYLTNSEVFSYNEEINKIYDYTMNDFKKLFSNKILNKILNTERE